LCLITDAFSNTFCFKAERIPRVDVQQCGSDYRVLPRLCYFSGIGVTRVLQCLLAQWSITTRNCNITRYYYYYYHHNHHHNHHHHYYYLLQLSFTLRQQSLH